MLDFSLWALWGKVPEENISLKSYKDHYVILDYQNELTKTIKHSKVICRDDNKIVTRIQGNSL